MNTIRWSTYKQGYVKEDGDIIEPIILKSSHNKPKVIPIDHFIVQEEFDGLYWISAEGTEEFN